jgi:hypothetical protein
MADITIVNGVYKPTYNWGAPSCKQLQAAAKRLHAGLGSTVRAPWHVACRAGSARAIRGHPSTDHTWRIYLDTMGTKEKSKGNLRNVPKLNRISEEYDIPLN